MLALIAALAAAGAVPLKVEVSVAGAPTSRVSAVVTATPGFEGGVPSKPSRREPL